MNSSKSNFATIAAVAAVILVAVVGGVIYLLTRDPIRTANIRDIVIIVLVFITILFNLIIGGLVVALVYQVRGLVSTVTTEIKPITILTVNCLKLSLSN